MLWCDFQILDAGVCLSVCMVLGWRSSSWMWSNHFHAFSITNLLIVSVNRARVYPLDRKTQRRRIFHHIAKRWLSMSMELGSTSNNGVYGSRSNNHRFLHKRCCDLATHQMSSLPSPLSFQPPSFLVVQLRLYIDDNVCQPLIQG